MKSMKMWIVAMASMVSCALCIMGSPSVLLAQEGVYDSQGVGEHQAVGYFTIEDDVLTYSAHSLKGKEDAQYTIYDDMSTNASESTLCEVHTVIHVGDERIAAIGKLPMLFRVRMVKNLDLTGFETSQVNMVRENLGFGVEVEGWYYKHFECFDNLEELNCDGCDFSGTDEVEDLLNGAWKLKKVSFKGANFDGVTSLSGFLSVGDNLETADFSNANLSTIETMQNMFSSCGRLKDVVFHGVDTPKLKSMAGMFLWAGIEQVDLEGLDTSAVTDMSCMFGTNDDYFPVSLKRVDFSKLDLSAVEDMSSMFLNCAYLESVTFGQNQSSALVTTEDMFKGCKKLESVDLRGLNGLNVINAWNMFNGCKNLKSVSLFNMNNPLNCASMFKNCYSLASVNMDAINTKDASLHSMFLNCAALTSLDLSQNIINPDKDVTDMFKGCTRLVHLTLGPDCKLDRVCNLRPVVWEREGVCYTSTALCAISKKGKAAGEWIGLEKETEPSLASFTDLDHSAWYFDSFYGVFPRTGDLLYIEYAIKSGLMRGMGVPNGVPTTFEPNTPLTRAMAAVMLYRCAFPDAYDGTDSNESGLYDVEDGQWYTRAVNWCVGEGIITGYQDANGACTYFGPDDFVTREQMAAMIERYCVNYCHMAKVTTGYASFVDTGFISPWAQGGVSFCLKHGIMTGVGQTDEFQPQYNTLRCQMAKIIAVTYNMILARG